MRTLLIGLTRREFLTLSGASMLAAALPLNLAHGAAVPVALQGRALVAAAVQAQPAESAPLVKRLWPDSTVAIREVAGDWYAVEGGYVRRCEVQPMVAYTPSDARGPDTLPAWGEVIAPVVPVRGWASARSPLVTRIGYGGVLYLRDTLVDERGLRWYGVAANESEALLGWTAAPGWAVVELPTPESDSTRWLQVDRARSCLRAWQGWREVIRLPAALPDSSFTLAEYTVDGRFPACQVAVYQGASWALAAGELRIYGAYWHNTFGADQSPASGSGISIMPWAARWLYAWLPDGARVQMSLR